MQAVNLYEVNTHLVQTERLIDYSYLLNTGDWYE